MEIIEEDENDQKEDENSIENSVKKSARSSASSKSNSEKIKILKRSDKSLDTNDAAPTSTAQVVKKKLETQLKSIIRQSSTNSTPSNQNFKSFSSMNHNTINNESHLDEEIKRIEKTYEHRRKELFNQINNHSFKDIDLIRIESRIEPSDLKDLKAAQEAKIPKVNTIYNVNVLKKPYSMKWLRYRRLTLFLQSELYSEFKLAMILSQFGLFNNDLGSNYCFGFFF